jgi:hypothetical protein
MLWPPTWPRLLEALNKAGCKGSQTPHRDTMLRNPITGICRKGRRIWIAMRPSRAGQQELRLSPSSYFLRQHYTSSSASVDALTAFGRCPTRQADACRPQATANRDRRIGTAPTATGVGAGALGIDGTQRLIARVVASMSWQSRCRVELITPDSRGRFHPAKIWVSYRALRMVGSSQAISRYAPQRPSQSSDTHQALLSYQASMKPDRHD